VREFKHRNRLPREIVESLSLELFGTSLYMVLGSLLQLALL